MKNLLLLLAAAVLGGLAAIGGAQYLGLNQTTKYVEIEGPAATNYANFAEPSTTVNVNPAPTEGFTTAADKALPAVVHIKASKVATPGRGMGQMPDAFRDFFGLPEQEEGNGRRREAPLQQGSGSGVIISPDGYIATNNHVVEDAEDLQVVLNDQRTYDAEVIGVDPTTDIALIKIDETALPTLRFANSDNVRVGEWVVAVGNPFSLTSTVTAGIVSAKGRSIDIVRRSGGEMAIESFIQTDAVVNPGNSGGALVNQNGDLVGINTAISSPTGVFAGYSFAVPSAIVKKVTEDLREFGVVQRGLLGARIIDIQRLPDSEAEKLGIERDNGVYVSEVTAGSAAEDAGLTSGDIILSVNGIPTLRNSDLLEQLGRKRPGDEVTIGFERDGREQMLDVRLRNADGNTQIVRAEPAPEKVMELGAEFVDLSATESAEAKLEGVKIQRLKRDGLLAEQTRIQPGFIVTAVNDRAVTDAKDLQRLLNRADGAVKLEGIYPDAPDRKLKFAIIKD